jgi:hypothetical protein
MPRLVSLSRHLLLVPIAIPLSAAVSPSRLETAASAFGKRLADVTVSIEAACAARPPELPLAPAPDVVVTLPEEPSDVAAPTPLSSKRGSHPSKRPVKASDVAGGIYVGKEAVLRLVRAGVVPTGQPTAASSSHPAGILLSGVGALGIGLHDGDILTDVEGHPVRTEAQVVGMVLAARSRHAEQMSAIIWRASDTGGGPHPHTHPDAHSRGKQDPGEQARLFSLVVAMPYL